MERIRSTGIVSLVNWIASESVDGFTETINGTASLTPPTGTPIPYTELTEATVIEWVTTSLGEPLIAILQKALDGKIATQKVYQHQLLVCLGVQYNLILANKWKDSVHNHSIR